MDEYLVKGRSYERLFEEYKKHGSLVIGYDFDSTVHDYHKTGATYDKVIQLLRDLKSIGCKVICWTAYKDHEYVEEFLNKNEIPFDGINTDGIELPWETRKPFFSALLDDRAGLIQVYEDLRKLADYHIEYNRLDDEYEQKMNGTISNPIWAHPGEEPRGDLKELWEAAKPKINYSNLKITPGKKEEGNKVDPFIFDEVGQIQSSHIDMSDIEKQWMTKPDKED